MGLFGKGFDETAAILSLFSPEAGQAYRGRKMAKKAGAAQQAIMDDPEAAQAWLDGDYGRAMALTERNRRDRKRRNPNPWREKEWRAQQKGGVRDKAGPVEDGTIIESPLTKARMIYERGEWKPWK